MFAASSDRMYAVKSRDGQIIEVPLHNYAYSGERPHEPEEASPTGVNVPDNVEQGAWGERDIGGPVNFRMAMQDYENMRRELTNLSRSGSRQSRRSITHTQSHLQRVISGLGRHESRRRASEVDVEAEVSQESEEDEEQFELGDFLREGHFEKRKEGHSAKKVGVVFRSLTVRGIGATATFVKTLPSALLGTFGPDLYKLLSRFIPGLPKFGIRGEMRDLIHDFTGVVRDGEMLLVLGRPGSGCSTFLKAIANKREGFARVTGDVHYGGINAAEQKRHYRGEVNYNEEDDQHFPTLTVGQTLIFSLLNKTKKHEEGDIPVIVAALLKMFGISHTEHTLVGDGEHNQKLYQSVC